MPTKGPPLFRLEYQKSPQCGPNASFADHFGNTANYFEVVFVIVFVVNIVIVVFMVVVVYFVVVVVVNVVVVALLVVTSHIILSSCGQYIFCDNKCYFYLSSKYSKVRGGGHTGLWS